MEMKSFLIIGMGSFGHHLCRSLAENECEIMVVDKDSEAVEDVLPLGVSGRVGDCTNIDVLRSFSIDLFDACFVCIGYKLQKQFADRKLPEGTGSEKGLCQSRRRYFRRNS